MNVLERKYVHFIYNSDEKYYSFNKTHFFWVRMSFTWETTKVWFPTPFYWINIASKPMFVSKLLVWTTLIVKVTWKLILRQTTIKISLIWLYAWIYLLKIFRKRSNSCFFKHLYLVCNKSLMLTLWQGHPQD